MDTNDLNDPEATLALLSEKHRAVMDLVCEDFSYKEIAHRLKISLRTVEQRMASVRSKLETFDRSSTARAYRRLKAVCGQTTCGLTPLDSHQSFTLPLQSDAGLDPVFTLNDAGFPGDVWVTQVQSESRSRDDGFWGRVNRFGIIVLIAFGMTAGLAVLVATMNGLNDLL